MATDVSLTSDRLSGRDACACRAIQQPLKQKLHIKRAGACGVYQTAAYVWTRRLTAPL